MTVSCLQVRMSSVDVMSLGYEMENGDIGGTYMNRTPPVHVSDARASVGSRKAPSINYGEILQDMYLYWDLSYFPRVPAPLWPYWARLALVGSLLGLR